MSRWVVYFWRRAHVFHQRNVGFIPAIAEDLNKEIVVSLGLHPIIRQYRTLVPQFYWNCSVTLLDGPFIAVFV